MTALVPSLIAALASEGRARADDPEAGLAIDRLDRPAVGSRFYASDTLALREPWRPAFGIVSGYTYRAFSIVQSDGSRSSLVRNLWTADVAGEIVVPGGLRLGLSLPTAIYVDGRDTQIGTSAVMAPTSPAVGDLRVTGDVYAYGEAGSPFSLAVGVAVYLPTGMRESFMGDGTARVQPRVLMTGRSRALVWGVRAGYMLRPHEEFLGGVELGSEAVFGGSFGLARGPVTVGPELLASTVVSSKSWFTKETTPVEALLSAHLDFHPALSATLHPTLVAGAGVGTRFTEALGAPSFRGVLSLEYVPEQLGPPKDRDNDGVPDDLDHCPDVPGCDPREPGCPIAPIDTDGDGRPDYQPSCFELPSGSGAARPSEPSTSPAAPTTPTTLDPCERVDSTRCGQAPEPNAAPTSSPSPPASREDLRTWGAPTP